MKFQLLYLCCDDPLFACECELYCFFNEFGNFSLAEHAQLLPLGTKSVENP
jgi:hypothetical protein